MRTTRQAVLSLLCSATLTASGLLILLAPPARRLPSALVANFKQFDPLVAAPPRKD